MGFQTEYDEGSKCTEMHRGFMHFLAHFQKAFFLP